MNYNKHYDALIQKAQSRNTDSDTYYHIHHIKPASMCRVSQRYGTRAEFVWDINADNTDNLVQLTLREHYIAHLLLAKMYHQMAYTIVMWRGHSKNSKAFASAMKSLSTHQQQQYANGIHNFHGLNEKRVNDGTHNFLLRDDGSSVGSDTQKRKIANGTHHFQGEAGATLAAERNKKMIKKGTHVSVNKAAMNKFKETRQARVDSGNWHTCGVRPWNNNSTKAYGRMIYASANEMYELWLELQCGSRKLSTLLKHNWSATHDRIVKMFRDGWEPSLDSDWVSFRSSYDE